MKSGGKFRMTDFDDDGYGEPPNQDEVEIWNENQRARERQKRADRLAASQRILEKAAEYRDYRDFWHKRWQLSLAVANGVAFVSLSSVLIDTSRQPDSSVFVALLASAWAFAIGGAFAATIPLARARYFNAQKINSQADAAVTLTEDNAAPVRVHEWHILPEFSDELRERYMPALHFWWRYIKVAEWCSAFLFVVGIVLPLMVVTYFTVLRVLGETA